MHRGRIQRDAERGRRAAVYCRSMRGIEWVVDAHGCEPAALADLTLLRSLFDRLIAELQLTPVGDPAWHVFAATGGVTGFVMLAESHLACHTFPEFGSICLNVFCCRTRADWDARRILSEMLGAGSVDVAPARRGSRVAPDHDGSGRSLSELRRADRVPLVECGPDGLLPLPVRGRAPRRQSRGARQGQRPAARQLADPDRHRRPLERQTVHRRRPHRLRARRRRLERVASRLCGRRERMAVGRTGRVRHLGAGRANRSAAGDRRACLSGTPYSFQGSEFTVAVHHRRALPRRRRRTAVRLLGQGRRPVRRPARVRRVVRHHRLQRASRRCCSSGSSSSTTRWRCATSGTFDEPAARSTRRKGFNCKNCGAAVELRALQHTRVGRVHVVRRDSRPERSDARHPARKTPS